MDIVREDPLGSGDKGRVAEAICRKADDLQVGSQLGGAVVVKFGTACRDSGVLIVS